MADDINPTNDDAQTPENNEPVENTPGQEANLTTSTDQAADTGADNGDTAGNAAGSAADDVMQKRVDRLGGEPAPAISPEEFARLQQAGQIHIDSRGRVRTNRREETDAGMSLRKRRAWYAG